MKRSTLVVVGVAILVLAAATPAWADQWSVSCPGESLRGLLFSLGGGTHTITIRGECVETLLIIDGFDHLTLQGEGTPRAVVIDQEPIPPQWLGVILNSQVTLRNLEFRGSGVPGGGPGIFAADSTLTVENCLIDGFLPSGPSAALGALFLGSKASATIQGTTIQGNSVGVFVANGSNLALGLQEGDEGSPVRIQRNTFGVWVSGTVLLRGSTIIAGNDVGVMVDGSLGVCCEVGRRRITDNRIGIVAHNGAQVSLAWSNVVERNTDVGLFLAGASLQIVGGTVIQENGSYDPSGRGGILASNNSRVEIIGDAPSFLGPDPAIVDNEGAGIILTEGSSARIFDAEINNNVGDGVRVQNFSVVRLEGNSIRGNGGFSLFCSKSNGSAASGDLFNADKASCKTFEQSSEPALRLPIPQ